MGSTELLSADVLARLAVHQLKALDFVEGLYAGLHQSRQRGHSLEFAEHREYAPGDDLRHLDWKVYGRTDRFYIRQFHEESNLRAHLVLDISGSMGFSGRGGISKLAFAAGLATALAYLLIRQRDAVGLVLFSDQIDATVPLGNQKGHLATLLEKLSGISASRETALAKVLYEVGGRLGKRSLVILISDLLDHPEEVLRFLRHLRHRRHELIVLHVLDPAERDLPYAGQVLFQSLESGQRLPTDVDAIRPIYQRLWGSMLHTYQEGCQAVGIDYGRFWTDIPLEQSLSEYLARRAHARR